MLRLTIKCTQEFLLQRYFYFQTITVFFPPFLKYHVVFQDQSEYYIGEDEIIDITEVIVLYFSL